MVSAIKPMTRTARLVGIARTVRCFPGDYLTLLTALAEAREGEVLVVDGGGVVEAALLGKLMAIEARRKGLHGFVVNGAVRDLAGLEDVGLPVFARAATPRTGTAEHLFESQVPIICGGAPVQPGDIVHGRRGRGCRFRRSALARGGLPRPGGKRYEAKVERRLRRGRPLAEVSRLFDRLIELRRGRGGVR